ncbi:uncharacterized protein LOC116162992 [Photinus pyralis]|uniref:uncharacterized protein LOC116162992 n=1 Tax=Photinus pyralis TaxID=7054 RepID=UPI001267183C|nr:uncharacterized protein LOC116162992 [Photinus pyralis]
MPWIEGDINNLRIDSDFPVVICFNWLPVNETYLDLLFIIYAEQFHLNIFMMEPGKEITSLRHSRAIIKASLTRFVTFLNKPENRKDITQLQLRLNKIQSDFQEYNIIQNQLELLDQNESADRDQIENSFFENMSLANDLISNVKIGTTSSPEGSNQFLQTGVHENCQVDSVTNLKLPRLSLPEFHGSYDTFVNFENTFSSLIHENKNLNKIQKMFYLKSCLKGDAHRLVQSLEITSDNYDVAWDMLKKRYENKRVIVNSHIKSLFELPTVTKDSYILLRKLLDSVFQHMSSLEKLNVNTKEWDQLIIYFISTKIDQAMKKEWENSLPTNSLPTLQEFIEFLTKRCFTLETLYNHSQTNIHNTKSIPNKQLPQFSKPFKDREHSFAITNTILCPYCKNNHYIYNCYAFLNLPTEEKFSQIRKMKLCSNCLRSGHLKNSCHSSKCRKCNKSHNTLLHDDNFNAHKFNTSHNARNDTAANIHQAQSSVMQVINSETSQQQPSESQNITRTYHSFTGICQTEVLLSTAEVFIDDRFGRSHKCRVLLDSGSQSHLITQKLCNKLQLNLEEFSLHLKEMLYFHAI